MPNEFVKHVKNDIIEIDPVKGEIKKVDEDGEEHWFQDTIMPIFDENNIQTGEVIVRHDITEKKYYEKMAITDPLTHIYNRRHFNEVIEREINRAKREQTILCFVILDVDYFKKYNDTYGHIAGDKALISVAHTLRDSLHRGSDYTFRLGGEEFGVIFNAKNEKQAVQLSDKIRNNIEKLNIVHSSSDVSSHLTASLGLVSIDFAELTADKDELYRLADSALYLAKENGRNQVFLHENDEMEFF